MPALSVLIWHFPLLHLQHICAQRRQALRQYHYQHPIFLPKLNRTISQQFYRLYRLLRKTTQYNSLSCLCSHHKGIHRTVFLHKTEVVSVPVGLFFSETLNLNQSISLTKTRHGRVPYTASLLMANHSPIFSRI